MIQNIKINREEIEECDMCFIQVTANYVVIIKESRILGSKILYFLCYNCFDRLINHSKVV